MSEDNKVTDQEAKATTTATTVTLSAEELAIENATLRRENAERRKAAQAAEAKLLETANANKLADEEAAKKRGEYEKLYEGLKGEHESATAKAARYEATLTKYYQSELESIPEDKRVLLDHIEGIEAKLEFIATAKATGLFAQATTNTAPGVRTSGEPGNETLEAQLATAHKEGRTLDAIAIKRKIYEKTHGV